MLYFSKLYFPKTVFSQYCIFPNCIFPKLQHNGWGEPSEFDGELERQLPHLLLSRQTLPGRRQKVIFGFFGFLVKFQNLANFLANFLANAARPPPDGETFTFQSVFFHIFSFHFSEHSRYEHFLHFWSNFFPGCNIEGDTHISLSRFKIQFLERCSKQIEESVKGEDGCRLHTGHCTRGEEEERGRREGMSSTTCV